MELVLVRHGEPGWARDGRSVDDPDLTERGWLQAKRTAEIVAALGADQIFVSPLRRARQTAEPLAEMLRTTPIELDWLAEITAPTFEGSPIEHVEKVFADCKARPMEEQWDGIPGGESFRDFHRRVVDGWDQLLTDLGAVARQREPRLWDFEPDGRRIVVVAHAGTNSVTLSHLLGFEPVPWEWERFVTYHASVSTVRPLAVCGARAFSLHRLADVGHLPPDLQTR
jgi:2,3-bisphosphoglycerate-dependent phosphoglycerate mutase